MPQRLRIPLVVVCGPTASGKTDLSQRIAQRLGGCVLSADSMQIYTGMDIGTGKLAPADRIVPHYGFDLVDPGAPYSASLFQAYGRGVVDRCDRDATPCVICGGTGFYIRAVVDAYEFPKGDQVGNPVREAYTAKIAATSAQAVWEELKACDPASAALIHPHDTKRLVRAFEMRADGTTYAAQHAQLAHIPPFYEPVTFIGLGVDPDILRSRIDARVDQMIAAGLVDEVRGLLDRGFRDALTAQQAIGYKEIVAALEGRCTIDEAVDQIKFATHRYAKRQRTWFRKDARIQWLTADTPDFELLTDQSLAEIERTMDENR
ncbi:MAG: tRNA (adenosine(37)-N6)-dimethylallyltransferase MiaA [Eggerthellaceae bacterium]|nr:tRNA (adenosine(37)-N6)-dimethylallyltransferase MiaA [Eggerthellaceae bacterium]